MLCQLLLFSFVLEDKLLATSFEPVDLGLIIFVVRVNFFRF